MIREDRTAPRQALTAAEPLDHLATLELIAGRSQRAVTLFSASQVVPEATSFPRRRAESVEYDHNIARAMKALGEDQFNPAWAQGQELTIDRAVAYALANSTR